MKGPAEKGHVELAISKPKAGGGFSSFWLCTELQCSVQRIHAPLSTRGGGATESGGGGGFSGLNTKPVVPNHSKNQSAFPNKFFGPDAMNNRITRERAYGAIHVQFVHRTCSEITSIFYPHPQNTFTIFRYFNYYPYLSIPLSLLVVMFSIDVTTLENVIFPGDNNFQMPMSWLSDRLAVTADQR